MNSVARKMFSYFFLTRLTHSLFYIHHSLRNKGFKFSVRQRKFHGHRSGRGTRGEFFLDIVKVFDEIRLPIRVKIQPSLAMEV